VVNGPGEALMTDVGFTGGGAGSGMVYLAGKQSHKMSNDQMIDHIVEQVEKKAAELEAARAAVRLRTGGSAPKPPAVFWKDEGDRLRLRVWPVARSLGGDFGGNAMALIADLPRNEQGIATALDLLRQRFGADRVETGQALREQHGHTTTWLRTQAPDAVIFPGSTEEVQEIVRICAAHRVPIVAFGTGPR
jgi:hypothetical protein